ncbi:alpha/beta hydrolase [Nostoc sp.]|uniref:alpha/beta hydrolase n=1 Tax=Nostoc sp. TaxID=1180 RepID=UPI002FF5687F
MTEEGYTADEASIEASEKYISKFLRDWIENTEIQKVHIIAHSMANRGLLRVMQRIFDQVQTKTKVSFGQLILAAPDVDAFRIVNDEDGTGTLEILCPNEVVRQRLSKKKRKITNNINTCWSHIRWFSLCIQQDNELDCQKFTRNGDLVTS